MLLHQLMAPASRKPKHRWLWIPARARGACHRARVRATRWRAWPGRREICRRAIASQHPKRLHVGFQDGFLFGPLVSVLLAQALDGAQCLDVEAIALGLPIADAAVVRDPLLFFFQPLDA